MTADAAQAGGVEIVLTGRRELGRAHRADRILWLTKIGFPRGFPIVQFPNAPLIVALVAGRVARVLRDAPHAYLASLSYLAMTVWAYDELIRGVNWFRRLLGLAFAIILIIRVAHAMHS
jgi:hypothetical protein